MQLNWSDGFQTPVVYVFVSVIINFCFITSGTGGEKLPHFLLHTGRNHTRGEEDSETRTCKGIQIPYKSITICFYRFFLVYRFKHEDTLWGFYLVQYCICESTISISFFTTDTLYGKCCTSFLHIFLHHTLNFFIKYLCDIKKKLSARIYMYVYICKCTSMQIANKKNLNNILHNK